MINKVIKRNGKKEEFIASKLNYWGKWASENLNDRLDWSSVVLETVKSLPIEVSSRELQNALIKVCVEKKDWPHSLMAGKLYSSMLQKDLYGYTMPTVREICKKLAKLGLMKSLDYSYAEYEEIEKLIKHDRDFNMAHFQIEYILNKYSIQNKKTKQFFETPQYTYMRMALALAEDEPKSERLIHIKNWYNHFSLGRINAPTPNYNNLGTNHNGYSSCCLYTTKDTASSLAIGDHIAYTMTYMSAGIGGLINTRTLGDPIKNGLFLHQGKKPYLKAVAGAVNANKQGSRGGACTQYYSGFDPEANVIAQLQNPRSTEANRNRDIHFSVITNRLFAKKVATNQDIFTFTSFSAPDLFQKMFSGDQEGFEELYNQYEANPLFEKRYVNARQFIISAIQQSYEVGTHYLTFIDEINRHTPFVEPIYTSNLCVAPETKVLTDKGYIKISALRDRAVNIWNGFEWSKVLVKKTNDRVRLLKIITDSGHELECTEYHKFHIQEGYTGKGRIIQVEAKDLKEGMSLIKHEVPIIKGYLDLDKAYINGFYSGDGCLTEQGQRIYLYNDKRSLKNEFYDCGVWTIQDEYNRIYTHYKDLKDKFFVPDASYSMDSRLQWLCGYADSDGCIYRNKDNQQLVLISTNKKFLVEVSYMLQTMGVNPKIKIFSNAGYKKMPTHREDIPYKEYYCNEAYRLIIQSTDLQKLLALGANFKRLSVTKHSPKRDARKFVRISSILDEGRYDETYCFEEPKRHLATFNGIVTGQCQEITLPTHAYENMLDLYGTKDNGYIEYEDFDGTIIRKEYSELVIDSNRHTTFAGNLVEGIDIKRIIKKEQTSEVALCSLAAIVVPNIKSDEEYRSACYYALKMIMKCIHMSEYALPHIGYTAKQRMSAGVGIVGLAYHLAKLGLKYNTKEGYEEIHKVAEKHSYFLIEQSLKIAKETQVAPWIHKTKWPKGWLPIDTYKRNVDNITNTPLQYDWEGLRKEIIANGGIAHSSLVAHMPTESSSKPVGVPNGLYPIRELSIKKSDQTNLIDWVAVDSDILKDKYQSAWSIPSEDLIKVYAIFQKFADQAISADLYKDRSKDINVSDSSMVSEYLDMIRYGMKTRYYQNSQVSNVEVDTNTRSCESGACDV